MRFMSGQAMLRLLARALDGGAHRKSMYHTVWDVSGDCESPVVVNLQSRVGKPLKQRDWLPWPDKVEGLNGAPAIRFVNWLELKYDYHWDSGVAHWLEMETRCRKCPACRNQRMRMWMARAASEYALSPRTWFGTLTVSAQWHERFAASARLVAKARFREDFELLPVEKQVHLRDRQIQPHITLMFKKMRKGFEMLDRKGKRFTHPPMQFRYLLVMELHPGHKNGGGPNEGMPHYHLLLHEIGAPITKHALEQIWPFGFVNWRLCEDIKPVLYAAKYLTKETGGRVRASQSYGSRGTPLGSNECRRAKCAPDLKRASDFATSEISPSERSERDLAASTVL